MTQATRDQILRTLPAAKSDRGTDAARSSSRVVDSYAEEIGALRDEPTMYAGLVDAKGQLQLYDGALRFRNAMRQVSQQDRIEPEDYQAVDRRGERCGNRT